MIDVHLRGWEPLFHPRDLARGPLLVLVPHPDDEVLGAGGLILAHREAGQRVRCLVMTDGRLGDATGQHGDEYPMVRKHECSLAAVALGGAEVEHLDFPDCGLVEALRNDPCPLVDEIVSALQGESWATIAFPSPYELHPDHKATGVAAMIAVERAYGGGAAPTLLAYEVGSFMPANLLINITDYIQRKQVALACYATQLEHHDLTGKMSALGVARTANVDDRAVTHAEAYHLVDPKRAQEYLTAVDGVLGLTDEMGPPVPWT